MGVVIGGALLGGLMLIAALLSPRRSASDKPEEEKKILAPITPPEPKGAGEDVKSAVKDEIERIEAEEKKSKSKPKPKSKSKSESKSNSGGRLEWPTALLTQEEYNAQIAAGPLPGVSKEDAVKTLEYTWDVIVEKGLKTSEAVRNALRLAVTADDAAKVAYIRANFVE
jgi:hypothetical protein